MTIETQIILPTLKKTKSFWMRVLKYFSVFAPLIMLCSCDKNAGDGDVTVTVEYENKPIAATVYVKKGTLTNPGLSLDSFDYNYQVSSDGQVYITNLPPDKYYFFAKGYLFAYSYSVSGDSSLTIVERFRQNEYNLTIFTHR